MKSYLTHTPWWLRKIYPTCIWNIPVNDKTVFLTFDDGPHAEATQFVLQQLHQYHAKATFFCIGKNVAQHPEIFEQIKAAGHAVGNHTMNHANGWKTSDEDYLKEIAAADILIGSKLFRPPYGRIKKSQLRKIQGSRLKGAGILNLANELPIANCQLLSVVMWSILSGDFDEGIDGEQCYQNVIRHVRPGSIIVFHDSLKALPRLQYALPRLLEWLKQNGYQSKAINLQISPP